MSWKPAQGDDKGKVDLGAIYSKEDNLGAFAAAEITSQEAGTARFQIGSDDTMIVWINGKQVYKLDGSHSYSPEQDRFEAALMKGTNRIVVRSGNGNGEWQFGVQVATTKAPAELARVEAMRRALPQASIEARAAIERLGQKLYRQNPADDAAEELAAEVAELAKAVAKPVVATDPLARRDAADDAHRLATALRGLNLPDAPAMQAEAVRLVESSARALDAPTVDARPEVARAAESSRTLADRLADPALAEGRSPGPGPGRSRGLKEADPDRAGEAESRLLGREQVVRGWSQAADPHASTAAAQAAELTERIVHPTGDPSRPTPSREGLAAAQTEAAAKLGDRAEHLPDTPPIADTRPRERKLPDAPHDPELDPLRARAGEAKALAQRERRLRERLQSILGERVPPQEDLRREAAELGRALADLRDQSREPGPSGRGPADHAADLMNNHAARQMGQALDELAQGRPDPARDAQRQAAEFVGSRAGQAAEDLAHALHRDRPAEANPADSEAARNALAEAGRRLAEPGRGPAGPDAGGLRLVRHAEGRPGHADRRPPPAGSGPGPARRQPERRPAAPATTPGATPRASPPPTSPASPRWPARSRPTTGASCPATSGPRSCSSPRASTATTTPGRSQLYFQEIAADGAKRDAPGPRNDGAGARPK